MERGLPVWRYFLGLWCVLALLNAGHLFGTDGVCYFHMASSIAERGWFDVPPPSLDPNTRGGSFSLDRQFYYAPFTPGFPLYLAFWYLAGSVFALAVLPHYATSFFLSFANTFATAATYALLVLVLERYGYSRRETILPVTVALFGSLAFPYARYLYSEPLLGLVLVACWYGLLRWREGPSVLWGAFIVGMGAYAVLVRPPTLVVLPGLGLLAWKETATAPDAPDRRSLVALIIGAMVLGAGSIAAYNAVRYGSLFTTGYETLPDGSPRGFTSPLWYGLSVFLLSPGKALWLFCPFLVLSALGWLELRREDRPVAWGVAWVFLVNLVLYSLWCRPEGGYTWGPRFFVPFLPVLLLPALSLWRQGQPWRRVFLGLGGLGLAIQLLGVSVNFAGVIRDHDVARDVPLADRYYNPIKRRYNLWFEPFTLHGRYLVERLSPPGGLFAVRPPEVRLAHYESVIINDPYWDDCPDFWWLHLVKDGWSPWGVGLVMLVLLGGAASTIKEAYVQNHDPPAPADPHRMHSRP